MSKKLIYIVSTPQSAAPEVRDLLQNNFELMIDSTDTSFKNGSIPGLAIIRDPKVSVAESAMILSITGKLPGNVLSSDLAMVISKHLSVLNSANNNFNSIMTVCTDSDLSAGVLDFVSKVTGTAVDSINGLSDITAIKDRLLAAQELPLWNIGMSYAEALSAINNKYKNEIAELSAVYDQIIAK